MANYSVGGLRAEADAARRVDADPVLENDPLYDEVIVGGDRSRREAARNTLKSPRGQNTVVYAQDSAFDIKRAE
jgi:hypothetical protein